MPVTVRGGDILFNDGSTQAAGLRFDAADAIGSVMVLNYSAAEGTVGNQRKPGDTISGSYLFRCTSGNSGLWSASYSAQRGNIAMAVVNRSGGNSAVNLTTAFTANQWPSGTATWSPVSGTWRVLNSVMGASFDGYSGLTYMGSALCIRIS